MTTTHRSRAGLLIHTIMAFPAVRRVRTNYQTGFMTHQSYTPTDHHPMSCRPSTQPSDRSIPHTPAARLTCPLHRRSVLKTRDHRFRYPWPPQPRRRRPVRYEDSILAPDEMDRRMRESAEESVHLDTDPALLASLRALADRMNNPEPGAHEDDLRRYVDVDQFDEEIVPMLGDIMQSQPARQLSEYDAFQAFQHHYDLFESQMNPFGAQGPPGGW